MDKHAGEEFILRKPLFISGPSGVGKSYLTLHLVSHFNCKKIVTITTRNPRPGELQGVNYDFVSQQEYDLLEATDQLSLKDRLLGACYGIRRSTVETIVSEGRTPICEAYSPTIWKFKNAFPEGRAIFLMPYSIDLLVERMKSRGDASPKIIERRDAALVEIDAYQTKVKAFYDELYTVTWDNFEDIVNKIASAFL